jgi:hypothetical protein
VVSVTACGSTGGVESGAASVMPVIIPTVADAPAPTTAMRLTAAA